MQSVQNRHCHYLYYRSLELGISIVWPDYDPEYMTPVWTLTPLPLLCQTNDNEVQMYIVIRCVCSTIVIKKHAFKQWIDADSIYIGVYCHVHWQQNNTNMMQQMSAAQQGQSLPIQMLPLCLQYQAFSCSHLLYVSFCGVSLSYCMATCMSLINL